MEIIIDDGAVDLLKRHSGICGFIESAYRHSLASGAVRGIAPRKRREKVGDPFFLPTTVFQRGVSRRASLNLTPRQYLRPPTGGLY